MNNNIIQKNYKKLYEKYKYKYIKLKIKDKNVIIPDVITNITKQIYLKKEFIPLNEKDYNKNLSSSNIKIGGSSSTILYLNNTSSNITDSSYPSYSTHMDNCMCFMPCGS
jgi:hypothetical protein